MTRDEAAGMAWWNNSSEAARAFWLRAANTSTPAEAWSAFKGRQRPAGDTVHPERRPMIDIAEFYVVQTRALRGSSELPPSTAWLDAREFDEDGPAFDWADYLREDGDTEARVVRRWR